MFGSSLGRFTSPDPIFSSAKVENPKTWNRYVYALNNPLKYIDPLGLYEWQASAGGPATDDELLARSQDKSLKGDERKLAQQQYDFRQNFKTAMTRANEAASSNKLTAEQKQQVKESVDAYGSENEKNGVFVGVRDDSDRSKAVTTLQNNDSVNVTFNRSLKGDDLAIVTAHEGRHVADGMAWVNAGHPTGGNLDLNSFARETRGWSVSSYVAQAFNQNSLNAGGDTPEVWNKGWKAAEIEKKRAEGINNLLTSVGEDPNDAFNYSNYHKHWKRR